MFSHTIAALEKFDNQHDFERMCTDILNAQGYRDVVPIAPRGGSDSGKDITFTTWSGGKGLACVTLRSDIDKKFTEDFSQHKPGEYEKYFLFCNVALTASKKVKFITFVAVQLQAELVPCDIEALRSILDTLPHIRAIYLQKAKNDSNFAFDNKQPAILESYVAQMSELLLKEGLRSNPNDIVRYLARVQTLTVLPKLDADHKGRVLKFLYESGLIQGNVIGGIIDMKEADLSGANLSGAILSKACLEGANLTEANLTEVNLIEGNLHDTNLRGANLSGANLSGANLNGANLSSADLHDTSLHYANLIETNLTLANLSGADLSTSTLYYSDVSGADLSRANLTGASLSIAQISREKQSRSGANLSGANLSGANLTNTYLDGVNLSGANLDGVDLSKAYQSYEDLMKAVANLPDLPPIDIIGEGFEDEFN